MLLRDFNKINTELKKVQKEVDFFEEKVRSLFIRYLFLRHTTVPLRLAPLSRFVSPRRVARGAAGRPLARRLSPSTRNASPTVRTYARAQAIEDDEFVDSIAPFLSAVKSEMLLIKDRIDQLTDDYDELTAAYVISTTTVFVHCTFRVTFRANHLESFSPTFDLRTSPNIFIVA